MLRVVLNYDVCTLIFFKIPPLLEKEFILICEENRTDQSRGRQTSLCKNRFGIQ